MKLFVLINIKYSYQVKARFQKEITNESFIGPVIKNSERQTNVVDNFFLNEVQSTVNCKGVFYIGSEFFAYKQKHTKNTK